ncbi:carbohydrate-binding module family 18 protein [Karstenula rhodostoma CBS 690.94]|uniref:chitinase n=1 Tax=Karstenula rhodostoma CBS 690.94 TaxID=1392251 RepID=A0A9P4U7B5_9PLEO|nr:carbohydrate-binding module family 18 protein [Karstenula rhodostoma CBS 690.94]
MRLTSLSAGALLLAGVQARFVMYSDEWHPTRPTTAAARGAIDHVVLAFAMANNTAAFQPKVPISTWRSEYPNAKIMIAVGGWGDTIGFSQAAKDDATIQKFGTDIKSLLAATGADGVDIDWEYPGGNGADYKEVPNSAKTYEIAAFPKVLAAIRTAIGKDKLLSIAVPGKKIDMIAYTAEIGPLIWPSVDYINLMAYDLMNRRDTKTAHHTSVEGATEVVENYIAIGAPPSKMNLGFAFYAKFFQTASSGSGSALGIPIVPAEDAAGKDTLTSGAWTFEPAHMNPVNTSSLVVSQDGTCGPEKGTKCATGCCSQYGNCGVSKEHCNGACQHAFGVGCTDPDIAGSWQSAAAGGLADAGAGGQYFLDTANNLFWTWDTPEFISQKFSKIVRKYKLGGAMAWSLGEDSADWSHIKVISDELAKSGPSSGDGEDAGTVVAAEELVGGAEEPVVAAEEPVAAPAPTTLVKAAQPTKEAPAIVNVDGGEDVEDEEDAEVEDAEEGDDDDEWEYFYTDEDGNEILDSSEGSEE